MPHTLNQYNLLTRRLAVFDFAQPIEILLLVPCRATGSLPEFGVLDTRCRMSRCQRIHTYVFS
jgi:hypothetical protein